MTTYTECPTTGFKIPDDEKEDKNNDDLLVACHLTLGWIVAKFGTNCDGARWLATALKNAGSQSFYVHMIAQESERK